ncbi:uncharacterized protein PV09_06282 [Verruconis gallopava]|uniref:Nucleoside 2-deoxyribosyltransferase like n=1 Tax=Verruconis gallopava TaxID=253628 RepID=A0A0D1YP86_9PEZI|nr:uncharacterized protein PV09_06282 [Verruconis gallopava]KIW02477.1 hypothetical protein PV09_06282 [Verruconis gallopava]
MSDFKTGETNVTPSNPQAPGLYALPADAKAQACLPPVWPQIRGPSVFLAGSIEMGKAVDWQTELTSALAHMPVTILNPRRVDWDQGWEQDISNKEFKEQVDWEMDHLNKADVIALYFQPGTYSPISLLELGMHAADSSIDGKGKKLVVCCPEGFWRRGNVQIVCHRYGIELVETREELIEKVKEKLNAALAYQNWR